MYLNQFTGSTLLRLKFFHSIVCKALLSKGRLFLSLCEMIRIPTNVKSSHIFQIGLVNNNNVMMFFMQAHESRSTSLRVVCLGLSGGFLIIF